MTNSIDNGPTASARVAMAQLDRLQRAQSSATNKVAMFSQGGDSTRSAAFRLAGDVVSGERIKGMTFIAVAGQSYEVYAFGGFGKVAPRLELEIPSGEMVSEQSVDKCVSFRAAVSIGEKGGEVSLVAIGGDLTPGLFFMRATAI